LPAGATVGPSSLLTSLVAFWKLGEASGARADSGPNGLSLTDNNTVTQAAGKVGDAAQFTAANSEFLDVADNAPLSGSDRDVYCSGWLYLDTTGLFRGVMNKYTTVAGNREYILYVTNANILTLEVSGNGTATTARTATTFGALAATTWYFWEWYHDSVNDLIGIAVNRSAEQTAAHTTGIFNGTAAFALGSNAGGLNYFNGRQDAVGFWDRIPSAAERDSLYNSGAGREYPFA
jgi:hypothetical protein